MSAYSQKLKLITTKVRVARKEIYNIVIKDRVLLAKIKTVVIELLKIIDQRQLLDIDVSELHALSVVLDVTHVDPLVDSMAGDQTAINVMGLAVN